MKDIEGDYKPMLQQIQQHEESRINFTKYSIDKFVKHFQLLGKSVADHGNETYQKVQTCNSKTELNKFIEQHSTEREFPKKQVEYEAFKLSDAL